MLNYSAVKESFMNWNLDARFQRSEQMIFDLGINIQTIQKQFEIKPSSDCTKISNLYSRFAEAVEKLQAVETELTQQAETAGEQEILKLMGEADEKMKSILNWIFGGSNDFHKLLDGINLLAVAENGERVVTNLFHALEPVLIEGAKLCAGQLAKNR